MTTALYPIAILISGNGSNLQAIIDAISAKKTSAQIVVVISDQANAYGLERAKKAGIPTKVISQQDFPNHNQFDTELQNCLDQYQPKLIVLAGFMRILGPEFVQHFHGKVINIHPSLLPKFPGLKTHQRAIDEGETEHGVTIHFVTEDLDNGPIIAQAKLAIAPEDTAETLQQKIHQLEHQLYPEIINLFAEDKIK